MSLKNPRSFYSYTTIFSNLECSSPNESVCTNALDDGFHQYSHINRSSLDIDTSITPTVSPIWTWRRAEHTDIPHIQMLCTPDTESTFGTYDIVDLVETSLLPIVLLNYKEEVVAFLAVQDYPLTPFLPSVDWEQWMDDMYQIRIYSALNTRFIHLLVWDNQYKDVFIEKILAPVYNEDAYVEYILLQLPYRKHLKKPYKNVFFHYLAIMDLANEKRSVRKIRESKEPYLLGLFVALRICIGPNITIRKAKEEDNAKVIDDLLKKYPGIHLLFGENFYLNLFKDTPEKKDKRVILIGEYQNEKTGYGLMTYCQEVNLDSIDHYYNTFLFHGFRSYVNIKKSNEIYGTCNNVNLENPLLKFDRTVRLETRPIPSTVIEQTESRSPVSYFPKKHFTSIDHDETSDITILDRDFSVSMMEKDTLFAYKPIVQKEQQKEDRAKYELKRQICLSYANKEEIVQERNFLKNELETAKFQSERVPENSTAIEIELYLPGPNQNPNLVHNFLKYILDKTPKKKLFLLVTVHSHSDFQSLLHYFHLVERKRRTHENRDLYVCNRYSITGKFQVKEADMNDFKEIIAMTLQNPHYQTIQEDVFNILRHQTDPCLDEIIEKCYVFLCCQEIVGFAVVGPEESLEYLIGNYNVEDFIYFSLHRRDSHGYVKHFVLVPTFLHLTTFFLRGLMKLNFWTSIYAYTIPGYLMAKYPRFSILSGIEYWIPVQPRHLPEYWKDGLENLTPNEKIIDQNMPPFALHHMNYKMAGIQKRLYNFKIVIVGGGELALSFLEHLIFSPTSWYMGYRSITLISKAGLPNKFEQEYEKFVKMMLVSSERYDKDYLNRLCLESRLEVVEGTVTSIDRNKQFLLVDETIDLDYDYLFLFCGTQFLKPVPAPELVHNKECRVLIDEIKGIEKAHSDIPINLFMINNDKEAFYTLVTLKEMVEEKRSRQEEKIIVYGHCLNALSCITALLEFGIHGTLITLVEPPTSPSEVIDYAFNLEIYNSIKATLELCNILVYYQYSFSYWETKEEMSSNDRVITKIHFQSHNHIISLPAMAMISFEPKGVDHQTRLALQKACLVFDGRLVIDSNFLTNDKNIYAAGSLTRYKKQYYCEHYNHENYSSYEIGCEIAYRFQKRIRTEGFGHDYLNKERSVTEFTSPVVVSCMLPGGWNFVHITKPGPMMLMQAMTAHQGKVIQTGNSYDRNGQGYFRIILDLSELVSNILCFTTNKVDVRNLTCLYNKHESLLNKLLLRMNCGLIPDLYVFFREPWAYAIYHDRFPLFLDEIQMLYLQKLADENVSLYEAVAYSFNICRWQKVSDKDKGLIEDLFNYIPDLKEKIEKKLLEYIEYNDNHLTTYLTKKKLKDIEVLFKNSRLLEPEDMDKGVLPLVPATPDYIVPTPRCKKEIDKTVKKVLFEPSVPVDEQESKKKLDIGRSDHLIAPKEGLAFVSEDVDRNIPHVVVSEPGSSDERIEDLI